MGSESDPPGKRRDDCADDRQKAWTAALKARYDEVRSEPLPDRICALLEQLEKREQ
jgi:hypothetical protein